MCYTTMCGHAMISAGLVKQIRKAVTEGRMEPQTAAKILAKPCYCGIFNLTRAEDMLQAERNQADSKG